MFHFYLKRLFQYRSYASRPEQKNLRKFLINNNKPVCLLCNKYMPYCALECAHLKPRSICSDN